MSYGRVSYPGRRTHPNAQPPTVADPPDDDRYHYYLRQARPQPQQTERSSRHHNHRPTATTSTSATTNVSRLHPQDHSFSSPAAPPLPGKLASNALASTTTYPAAASAAAGFAPSKHPLVAYNQQTHTHTHAQPQRPLFQHISGAARPAVASAANTPARYEHSDPPPTYQHESSRQQPFNPSTPVSPPRAAVSRFQRPHPPSHDTYIAQNLSQPQQHHQQHPTYDPQSPGDRARQLGYSNSTRTNSTTTPGADNLGESAAGGGIAGIAYGVASANERDSGVLALKELRGQRISEPGGRDNGRYSMDSSREDNPYVPEPRGYGRRDSRAPAAALGAVRADGMGGGMAAAQAQRQYDIHSNRQQDHAPVPMPYEPPQYAEHNIDRDSLTPPPPAPPPHDPFGSRASLANNTPDDAFAGGFASPRRALMPAGAGAAQQLHPSGGYMDAPFQRRSQLWDHDMEHFNPNDIEDDGDDGLQPPPGGRRSVLGFPTNRARLGQHGQPMATAAGAGAGAGLGAALGGLASRDVSGKYSAVQTKEYYGPGMPAEAGEPEKSDWLKRENTRKRKLTWIAVIAVIIVLGAVIGGSVGGVLSSRNKSSAANAATLDPDDKGLLDASSPQIKKLMNNPNLHRVFPGMAYTPLNAQYPACLSNPVSQNNVTKDIAMLSQLTNTIRLYGTDCNQTDMVLDAFQRLNLKDMKVWIAVWLDNNSTTNDRGLKDMYSILDKHGAAPFEGVILGNEVLFRKDLTAVQLQAIIAQTRSNFTQKSINLPVAVADLGDNWTADLASDVDVVMSNVHPFFGGVPVAQAAGWAWSFWQTHDVVLTSANATKKNIISEIGWPSGGGQDCGTTGAVDTTVQCAGTQGAVAGIDQMNQFMDSFVCQSLTNGTDYFWFEAFDEPWKVQFNKAGQEWEDKWGLMDADRNLKNGIKIPQCNGQSIPSN